MLNIFKKVRLENLKRVLKETFKRVPLSVLISGLIFITLIIRIYFENFSQEIENILDKSIFTLVVTFFFSVGIYLFTETIGVSNFKKWFFQIDSLIFGSLFYYFFEENLFTNFHEETLVYIISTIIGVISFIFIAPFIKKIINKHLLQREIYIFSYHLLIKTLMSIIVGIVVMVLGFIALTSIFTLFDLNFINEGKVFSYWSSFVLAFFAPVFFLVNLPSIKINQHDKVEDNKFYSFLINYVGLPTILIYLLILYSYTMKVLLNFSEWPQGEVTWMVIGFSFFGYLIYFSSFIFSEEFKIVKVFRKYFPAILIPQIAMLFYAIFLRINQYDFTINRYLVVTFGLWLSFISLYFIFSKKKYLGTIFYSLLITIIIISIGPWSIYVYPERRQQNKLINNLKEAKILQEGVIKPLEKYTDISNELSGKIYGSINYLCNYHGCKTLDNIFEKEISEIKKEHKEKFENQREKELSIIKEDNKERIKNIQERKYRGIGNWELVSELTKKIKVRRYFNDYKKDMEKFLSFSSSKQYKQDNIKITGYDYYLWMSSYENLDFKENNKKQYSVILNINSEELVVYLNKEKIETFSLKDVFEEILKEAESGEENEFRNGYNLDDEKLTFDLIGKKINTKIHFDNISILNPEWEENKKNKEEVIKDKKFTNIIEPTFGNGYVLLKIK